MGTEDFIGLPASGDSGNDDESNESLSCNERREAYSQSSILKCKDDDVKRVELEDGQFEDTHCIPQSDLNDETQRSDSDMEIEDLNNLPDFSNTRSRNGNNTIRTEAEYLSVNSADESIQPSRELLQQNELRQRYGDVYDAESRNFEKDLVGNSSFLKTGGQLSVTNRVSIELNGFNSGVPVENGLSPSHLGGPSKIHKSGAISGVKRPRTAMDEQQPSVHIVYNSLTRASKQKLEELLKQWSEWHAQQGFLCQDCRKPRDNAAVNNARNKSKKHYSSGSRNSTRYYQNSRGGKYDDLRPGALDAETRQLLGLKELDPPPWLNRMRELGYPPGYLDPENEDQPSGITIFADEETDEKEDGEITETEYSNPRKKMSVEFPGINAPIPENADERLWAAEPSSSGLPRNWSNQRLNHHTDYDGRGNDHSQPRWSRDYRDDGPPGVDSVKSPPMSFTPRYGGQDFSYDSQSSRGTSRTPNLGRVHSDRGRRSPVHDDDYSRYGSQSSPLFSPPRRR
ncbi:Zinc finger CCHC domain-containing protein 8, partial [Cucurbita argyrosperma subsp. sororia]